MPEPSQHSPKYSAATDTSDTVFLHVRAFLADALDIADNDITPDSRIVDDLRADSLDLLEFVASAEHRWNIVIQEPDLFSIRTVGDACELIEQMITSCQDATENNIDGGSP